MSKHKRILFLWGLLLLVSLACARTSLGPTPPGPPIPVSTEEAQALEAAVKLAAQEVSSNNPIDLTLTEAQVTSYLAFQMQSQPQAQEAQVSNLQVFLREGRIQVFGDYEGQPKVKMLVSVKVQVSDGSTSLLLDTIELGPISAPDALRTQVQNLLDQGSAEFFGWAGKGYYIEEVTIQDGIMRIRARPR